MTLGRLKKYELSELMRRWRFLSKRWRFSFHLTHAASYPLRPAWFCFQTWQRGKHSVGRASRNIWGIFYSMYSQEQLFWIWQRVRERRKGRSRDYILWASAWARFSLDKRWRGFAPCILGRERQRTCSIALVAGRRTVQMLMANRPSRIFRGAATPWQQPPSACMCEMCLGMQHS